MDIFELIAGEALWREESKDKAAQAFGISRERWDYIESQTFPPLYERH